MGVLAGKVGRTRTGDSYWLLHLSRDTRITESTLESDIPGRWLEHHDIQDDGSEVFVFREDSGEVMLRYENLLGDEEGDPFVIVPEMYTEVDVDGDRGIVLHPKICHQLTEQSQLSQEKIDRAKNARATKVHVVEDDRDVEPESGEADGEETVSLDNVRRSRSIFSKGTAFQSYRDLLRGKTT